MAEETIDEATIVAGLEERPSRTKDLRVHGWVDNHNSSAAFSIYGSDAEKLQQIASEHSSWSEQLHPGLPYTPAEVIWAVRREMARTLEDVLSRRTRALLLDAHASIEIAEKVAKLMAQELDKDTGWQRRQVSTFSALANGYLLHND
jgi:glycerol-3-phosphate dehydrogenase